MHDNDESFLGRTTSYWRQRPSQSPWGGLIRWVIRWVNWQRNRLSVFRCKSSIVSYRIVSYTGSIDYMLNNTARRTFFSTRVIGNWHTQPQHVIEAPSVNAFKDWANIGQILAYKAQATQLIVFKHKYKNHSWTGLLTFSFSLTSILRQLW